MDSCESLFKIKHLNVYIHIYNMCIYVSVYKRNVKRWVAWK